MHLQAVGHLPAAADRDRGLQVDVRTAGQTAGQVRASALEGSGADPTQSMVDMMESMRAYEAGQKVIHTIDETLGKAASSVGSLS